MASQRSSEDNVSPSYRSRYSPPEHQNENSTSRTRRAGHVRFAPYPQTASGPRSRSRASITEGGDDNDPEPQRSQQHRWTTAGRRAPSTRSYDSGSARISAQGGGPSARRPSILTAQVGHGPPLEYGSNQRHHSAQVPNTHQESSGSARGRTPRNQELRWQEGLHQRLNDPRNPRQRIGPLSILNSRQTTDAFQAMYCLGNQYSVVHPRVLRVLGFISQPLPQHEAAQGFLLQQHGLVYPRRFIELFIEHFPYNIGPTSVYFLVLDDNLPYREIDVYLGQRALNQCSGGVLPTDAFSDSGTGGQESRPGLRRYPRRDPEGFTESSQSLFDYSITFDTETGGNHQGMTAHSTPITPGSWASRGKSNLLPRSDSPKVTPTAPVPKETRKKTALIKANMTTSKRLIVALVQRRRLPPHLT